MPVLAEYTWNESGGHMEVTIPLKGVSSKKVDVFIASTILKVSFPPFLLDLDLYDEIDEDGSRAVHDNGTLKICLSKRTVGIWGQPHFIGTKDVLKERRQKALNQRDEKIQRQIERVSQKKVEEERMVFQKHMELEEKERRRLDEIKATEKKDAENAMHDAFSRLQNANGREKSSANTGERVRESSVKAILQNKRDVRPKPQDHAEEGVALEIIPANNKPPPRKAVQASFRHTPRLFKTPSRESTIKQEQEFIIKNSSNLKKNALLNGRDIGDVDPVWLTMKGNEFYDKGDYCSAINAFTEALRADETLVLALSGRAACYLHLREGTCCVKDCLACLTAPDEAIEAHFDTVHEQAQFRTKTHIRLATAFCLTGEYENAMEHFTKVRKLDETNEVAISGMETLETYTTAEKWKKEADDCYNGGKLELANEFYSKALSVDPTHTKALMNRAACRLLMKNSAGCIIDCGLALSRCKRRCFDSSNPIPALLHPEPNVEKKWIVALLCRRAAAKELGNDLQGALEDLEEAMNTIRSTDDIDIKTVEKSIKRVKKVLAV
jgi:dyslexia susceptibility 1 candidate gene 1 protein